MTLLLLTAMLDHKAQVRLIWVLVGVSLAAMVLGALQLSGGEGSPFHVYDEDRSMLNGFQGNHNSTADFLLIALVGVPLILRDLDQRNRLPKGKLAALGITVGTLLLFALAVVLTFSRAGILLLPIALAACVILVRPWLNLTVSPAMARNGIAGAGIVLIVGVLLAIYNPTVSAVVARFDFAHELRPQIWVDAIFVLKKYFPFGVGMGGFAPALMADERVEVVSQFYSARAHNDFLELGIEAGLLGLAAMALVLRELYRALHKVLFVPREENRTLPLFAVTGLTILALHSLVDYPLRSMALAAVAALCTGLLLAHRQTESEPGDNH